MARIRLVLPTPLRPQHQVILPVSGGQDETPRKAYGGTVKWRRTLVDGQHQREYPVSWRKSVGSAANNSASRPDPDMAAIAIEDQPRTPHRVAM